MPTAAFVALLATKGVVGVLCAVSTAKTVTGPPRTGHRARQARRGSHTSWGLHCTYRMRRSTTLHSCCPPTSAAVTTSSVPASTASTATCPCGTAPTVHVVSRAAPHRTTPRPPPGFCGTRCALLGHDTLEIGVGRASPNHKVVRHK